MGHVFSCNGLYDPDITGVGHQPSGFDQVMALYDQYTVLKSTIRFDIFNYDANLAMTAGIALMDNATVLVDYRAYIESGRSTWTAVTPFSGSHSLQTLRHEVTVSKFMGRPKVEDEDDLSGTASANPADQCYWHLWADSHGSDASAAYGLVVIDYFAVLKEPIVAGLS